MNLHRNASFPEQRKSGSPGRGSSGTPVLRSQRGFGMIELLVAVILNFLLLAVIYQAYMASKQSYTMTEGISRLQENVRFAMGNLSRDLDASSYMGCLESTGNVINTLSIQTAAYDFDVGITGTDGGGTNPDTFTIRRAVGSSSIPVTAPMVTPSAPIQLDFTDADYANLEQYQILTISDCSTAATFMITNDPTSSSGVIQHDTATVAPIGALNEGQSNSTANLQYIYGATTASVATIYSSISTVYSIAPGADGTNSLFSNGVELVEGVEDMQVTYGLPVPATAPVQYQYVNAGGVINWNNVETVRVVLTLNTPERATANTTVANGLLSKTLTRTFRLRNRAP
jgi:type IV pilus assembly protein PilW